MRTGHLFGMIVLAVGLLVGFAEPASASWSVDDITVENVSSYSNLIGTADGQTGTTSGGGDTVDCYCEGSIAAQIHGYCYSYCSTSMSVCRRYVRGSSTDPAIDVAMTIAATASAFASYSGDGYAECWATSQVSGPTKQVQAEANDPYGTNSDGPNDDVDVVTLGDTGTVSASVALTGEAWGSGGDTGTANAQYVALATVNFQII